MLDLMPKKYRKTRPVPLYRAEIHQDRKTIIEEQNRRNVFETTFVFITI